MATVNINRKVTDSYYRYKMPRIQAKVEGRGNGIKTVIANLSEVSKALQRPPLYPLKYIGCELGAQTIGDVKNDRYIVNGAHDSDKLQNILDTFIEKYVLCDSCSNPETVLRVSAKKEMISMKCIACGHTTRISSVHRASAYILKNPPTSNTKPKSTNQKKSSKSTTNSTTTVTNVANGKNEVSLFPDNAADNNHNTNGTEPQIEDDHDECQWVADVSEAAVKQRQQMLSSHLRSLIVDADTDRPIHEKLEILREFIQRKLSSNSNLNSHFDDILGEVQRLDIEHKAIFSISSVLFDGDLVRQLSQHHNFLRRFCTDQPKVQKYLLASIERIVEQYMDQLIDKVPIIFKILFEAEIIDEEVFLEWDSKRSSRFVAKETSEKIKTAAFKFMDWLKNAEEESSESEDESPKQSSKPSVASAANVGQSLPVDSPESDAGNSFDDESQHQTNGISSYSLASTANSDSICATADNNDDESDINIDDI